MGKLVLFLKDSTPFEIPLNKERVTIGRRPDNDVCLPHPAVSGEHAAVVTILTDSFLEDLGSTNGTQVNGRAIVKHFLRDRDQIDIGRQLLVYLADSAAHAEPPPGFLRQERHELNQRVEMARRDTRDGAATSAGAGARLEPRISTPIDAEVDGPAAEVDAEIARIEPRIAPRAASPQPSRAAGPVRSPEIALSAPRAAAPPELGARVHPARDIRHDGSGGALGGELVAARRSLVDTYTQALPDEGAPPKSSAGPVRARVRVLTGPQAGRVVPMSSDEFVLGRVGVQVAAIVARGDGLALIPREGPPPVHADGLPVPPGGRPIAPGDGFEVAGTRLELLSAD